MSDLRAEFAALRPAGGFRVVLADPPWEFVNWSAAGEEKNPSAHYDCMAPEDILGMPVETLAGRDCALFLWATWPTLDQWQPVIRAWGFAYAGLAWEWIKFNPETGKYAFGPGYGTRKNLEPCLLATRGNPSVRADQEFFGATEAADGAHSVRDFIEAMPLDCIRASRREHSRKPEEQYQRIETLFDGPYVELFARHRRKGWSAWGRELDKFGAVS